ncbi:MAG: NarK family nitrate/nitrite MFS transporter [Elusimicrobia bacterium]|nr:NarK family nitrate/nitrite MFS transporter [Elusimicrobiota bacterium]
MADHWIEHWAVEDHAFWEASGKSIANRNMIFSVLAEFLAFSVWQVWSATSVMLTGIGFNFSANQLFWLAAIPGLTGATLRIPYALMVPILGGRNWTLISTALLLIPAVGIGLAVQDPATPYSTFALLALLCGFGGGNFASSMANINFFFPKRLKGMALGVNAAGGNIGVSIVQFIVPFVITAGLFGALGGASQTETVNGAARQVWVQNAAFIWVPFILLSLFTTWFFMNNLHVAKSPLRAQLVMLKDKHAWIMSLLYMGTFGSFIGYSAGFPLLIKSQFPDVDPLKYAFLGPLVGSLIRPVGGIVADKVGGARVTLWNFAAMAAAVSGVIYFLGIRTEPGAFTGFFIMFMALFVCAGLGNGSTYRMLPMIYICKNNLLAEKGGQTHLQAINNANRQSGVVVGITAAFAAYGAFFIPKSYGTSIRVTGGPQGALYMFIAFYCLCIALTYFYYYRKNAEIKC